MRCLSPSIVLSRMLLAAWLPMASAPAAEIVTITPQILEAAALTQPAAAGQAVASDGAVPPDGKEADWILGDHILRNDRIVAVIGDTLPTRHANMTVRNVGGAIIDLTTVGDPNDQLGCYWPGNGQLRYAFAGASGLGGGEVMPVEGMVAPPLAVNGASVAFRVVAAEAPQMPRVETTYTLADGDDFLTVTTRYFNPHPTALMIEPVDRVRADRTFSAGVDTAANVVWWDDEWFGQAYGIEPVGATFHADTLAPARGAGDPVRYLLGEASTVNLAPGASIDLVRRVFPARNLVVLRAAAAARAGVALAPTTISAVDAAGPVVGASVTFFDGETKYGAGRTDVDGRLVTSLPAPAAPWRVTLSTVGRGTVEEQGLAWSAEGIDVKAKLPRPGFVVATISAVDGEPIPCKVEFRCRPPVGGGARDADPDFGPDSGDTAVKNLRYSHNGRFRQEIPPGSYDVIISHGPEHDAVMTTLVVVEGEDAELVATLLRTVDTRGWVSSDFHSHATPSGDNTTSQLGRVQNLLCEQIEFAPCTEHNRVSSYSPLLDRLGARHRMATCSGIELTGSLLPVNHQNAFPIVEKPFTQDGGGPVHDNDSPVAQIERLALWDDDAEKVVQMNHPHLVQVLGDRDTDGTADGGFEGMLGFVDCVEVHPPHEIFLAPPQSIDPRKPTSPIFVWLQMLNLGYRVPGVVNTDAHYAFHGSGFLRNYLASPTDDPAAIEISDMVHTAERGRMVMTNGPFLEARLEAVEGEAPRSVGPGDDVRDDDGAVELAIRVQCPNWFDIDRVQVFVNGRPDPRLNFTRREHGALFSRDVVRFAHTIPVRLERDAHLIVAAIGESSTLGLVVGPEHA
ncbi:MAG: CehA/McbA family metallohydrolase, partial [Planctomycetia bacterium]